MTVAAILWAALALFYTPAEPADTPPPVHCATVDGTTLTAGTTWPATIGILVHAELDPTVSCVVAGGVEAGGYRPGDVVYRGHRADTPTLLACRALWPDDGLTQRDCVRVRACETGTLERAVRREPSPSNDYGAWQHSWAYIDDRLAAIGHPNGDRYDFWLNALMTRWLWDESGGSFRFWSCASKVGAR